VERVDITCTSCLSFAPRTFAENRRRSLASILSDTSALMSNKAAKQLDAEREARGEPAVISLFKKGQPPFEFRHSDAGSVESSTARTDRGSPKESPSRRSSESEPPSGYSESNVARSLVGDEGLYTPTSTKSGSQAPVVLDPAAQVVLDPALAGQQVVSVVPLVGEGLDGTGSLKRPSPSRPPPGFEHSDLAEVGALGDTLAKMSTVEEWLLNSPQGGGDSYPPNGQGPPGLSSLPLPGSLSDAPGSLPLGQPVGVVTVRGHQADPGTGAKVKSSHGGSGLGSPPADRSGGSVLQARQTSAEQSVEDAPGQGDPPNATSAVPPSQVRDLESVLLAYCKQEIANAVEGQKHAGTGASLMPVLSERMVQSLAEKAQVWRAVYDPLKDKVGMTTHDQASAQTSQTPACPEAPLDLSGGGVKAPHGDRGPSILEELPPPLGDRGPSVMDELPPPGSGLNPSVKRRSRPPPASTITSADMRTSALAGEVGSADANRPPPPPSGTSADENRRTRPLTGTGTSADRRTRPLSSATSADDRRTRPLSTTSADDRRTSPPVGVVGMPPPTGAPTAHGVRRPAAPQQMSPPLLAPSHGRFASAPADVEEQPMFAPPQGGRFASAPADVEKHHVFAPPQGGRFASAPADVEEHHVLAPPQGGRFASAQADVEEHKLPLDQQMKHAFSAFLQGYPQLAQLMNNPMGLSFGQSEAPLPTQGGDGVPPPRQGVSAPGVADKGAAVHSATVPLPPPLKKRKSPALPPSSPEGSVVAASETLAPLQRTSGSLKRKHSDRSRRKHKKRKRDRRPHSSSGGGVVRLRG